jgi:amidase
MGLNALTASEAAAKLKSGEITSEALVRDCLDRIQAREGTVKAWAYLDPELALAQARVLDGEDRRGPLHGVPIGIKDIFDTVDMPTAHGFPPYKGDRSGRDSACVAAFRAAGMVIMGKTVTTEFACPSPLATTNPHDPARTPGVSSSGSAASVADFMVPLANGTQTGGSVIGPAANCGVYGYKASLHGLDRGGFRHCKPSIDTLGLFARSIDDLILLRGVATGSTKSVPFPDRKLKIGLVRTESWGDAEPCMRSAIEGAAELLREAGADVSNLELPDLFSQITGDFSVVNSWEAGRSLTDEIANHLDSFNAHNRERVDYVKTINEADYQASGARLNQARAEMDRLFDGYDLFLTPSLAGEAPIGLTETRTAVFARLWTQMYTPTVNLPVSEGPNNLPVCIQLVGPRGSDDRTLMLARWVDALYSNSQ